jgi:hypothetical protein
MKPHWTKPLTTWETKSINAIASGLLEYEMQQLCLGEPVKVKKCKEWISSNKYPFKEKEGEPYETWLQEIELIDAFLSTGVAIKRYIIWR